MNIKIIILLLLQTAFVLGAEAITANAGNDITLCSWCDDEVTLDGSLSTGENLSYSWACESSDVTITGGDNQSVASVSFPKIDDSSFRTQPVNYMCMLTVSSGTEQNIDTVMASYKFTSPPQPRLYAKVDHESVVLSWTGDSENALDSLTGYSDFEGYRIYRSSDGGQSWGGENYKLYNYDGDHVGWQPYAIFDLSLDADTSHCTYTNAFCEESDDPRSISINGQDPYRPWVSLGSNSGVARTFVDSDVTDGIEYTYSITSYDTGLLGYTKQYDATSSGVCRDCSDPSIESNKSFKNCCNDSECSYDSDLKTCDCSDSSECEELDFSTIYVDKDEWSPSNPDNYFSDLVVCTSCLDETKTDMTLRDCCNSAGCIFNFDLNSCDCSDSMIIENSSSSVCDEGLVYETVQSFSSGDIGGYPSLESSIEELGANNTVTVIPGYYATNLENISFEGVEDASIFVEPSISTIGNGDMKFVVVNESALTDKVYKFEIDASLGVQTYEGYHTETPKLYIYEVVSAEDQVPASYQPTAISMSSAEETLAKFAEKPGARFSGICSPPDSFSSSETIASYDECIDVGGSWDFTSDIETPVYIVDEFELKYLDDVGYENNWTEFFDGMRFRLDNPDKENLDQSPVVINEQYTLPDSSLIENLKLEFFTSSVNYERRPSYSYMIELSHSPLDTAIVTTPFSIGDSVAGDDGVIGCIESCDYKGGVWDTEGEFCYSDNGDGEYNKEDDNLLSCNDHPCAQIGYSDFTQLPFRITNLTTGKKVALVHNDNGTKVGFYSGICDGAQPPDSYCENGVWKDLVGQEDCVWSKNEKLIFYEDVFYDGAVQTMKTYQLKVDFPLYLSYLSYGETNDWDVATQYEVGSQVKHFGMAWYSISDPTLGVEPNSFNNSWRPLYPWSTDGFSGGADPLWSDIDTLFIKPTRWYVDGDSWIADFSKIGLETETEEEDLELVRVVPNPYIISSPFNETPTSNKLWFTHLPQQCRIAIYTQTGEIVDVIEHDDSFSGQASWDLGASSLINDNGNMVAPGLYIYIVETKTGFTHFGKFAIVR